jgi:hypothetical protein
MASQRQLNVNDSEDPFFEDRFYEDSELIIETRHRFLTTLKGVYWHFFEEGQRSSETVILLLESAGR